MGKNTGTPKLHDGLLSVHDVCELYHVCPRTVYRWLASGRLVGKKAGGQWRFSRDAVLAVLK